MSNLAGPKKWSRSKSREMFKNAWIEFAEMQHVPFVSKDRFFNAMYSLANILLDDSRKESDLVDCLNLVRHYWETNPERWVHCVHMRRDRSKSTELRTLRGLQYKEAKKITRLRKKNRDVKEEKTDTTMRERIADSIKKRSEEISSKAVWHVSTTKQEQIHRRNHVKKMYTYDEDAFRNGFRKMVNNYFKLENPPDSFFKKPEETLTKIRIRNRLRPHGTLICEGLSPDQTIGDSMSILGIGGGVDNE